MTDSLYRHCKSRLAAWTGKLARADSGNMTVLMGIAMLAVALGVGAAIDFGRLVSARTALAAAADATALQVANSSLTDQDQLQQLAETTLLRNYDETVHGDLESLELAVNSGTVDVTATARFRTSFMRLAGIETINLPVLSEVIKSGNNIEVSLVLDTTGSMRGQKLRDLKAAAQDFVNTVVWDNQNQFYSKVAVVPYSAGVNLGAKAAAARGNVSGGTCATPGCQNYQFRNMNRSRRTFAVSTCVSECTGRDAYTDTPPSVAPVGLNYASPNNPCLDSALLPLSSDKAEITGAIDGLSAAGSTAGQIGIAWGWYVLSRDFGLWSGDATPAPYDRRRIKKIAIIMTDGEFNTSYCNGVVARNAGAGSGASDDKINCDASNGDSTSQSIQLCDAMKARGIAIYTIGFDIADDSEARTLMLQCASSAEHAYLAATGDELQAAFDNIGKKVTALRISR